MTSDARKARVLIFIVAYNAEQTISDVIARIPPCLDEHETEILVIDDTSQDGTFETALACRADGNSRFPMTVLYNPVNQGYGGNQKIGFLYAIRQKFDVVVLLHGDGQYAPERLPELLKPLIDGEADAVFGSRMMNRFGALKGGMPVHKYLGNKVLTWVQNRILGSSLSEFHSGYRLYSVKALQRIPFDLNTRDFHFDTEITIQLLRAGCHIKELPIPTFYGDEISHVKILKYGLSVVKASLLARSQDYGLFYERKFDVQRPAKRPAPYPVKAEFESPRTLALERVPRGSSVLEVSCGGDHVASALERNGCSVTEIEHAALPEGLTAIPSVQCDLDGAELPFDVGKFDYVLLLDVVENLRSPERFISALRRSKEPAHDTRIIVSTVNVAFVTTRLMLLLGYFNYGTRGLLALDHRRLFTVSSLRRLFEQAGYRIDEIRGVAAPMPLALGNTRLARMLLAVNRQLIRFSRSLFSYRVFMVARPLPSLEWLLERSYTASPRRKTRGLVRSGAVSARAVR